MSSDGESQRLFSSFLETASVGQSSQLIVLCEKLSLCLGRTVVTHHAIDQRCRNSSCDECAEGNDTFGEQKGALIEGPIRGLIEVDLDNPEWLSIAFNPDIRDSIV